MGCSIRHPDIHLGVWIGISSTEPHDGGVIVETLKYSVDQCSKLQRDHVYLHTQMRKIVLKQSRHLHALRIGRTGNDGKLDGLTRSVEQLPVLVPGKSCGFQNLPCGIE